MLISIEKYSYIISYLQIRVHIFRVHIFFSGILSMTFKIKEALQTSKNVFYKINVGVTFQDFKTIEKSSKR